MPLPLIPIALGLASAATAYFGAKKGFDAKSALDRAQSGLEDAEDAFEVQRALVDKHREQTNAGMQRLGAARLQASGGVLKRFVDAASAVHHVEHKRINELDEPVQTEMPGIAEMRVGAYEAADLLKDGLTAVPAGVLTGAGAMGAVSWLGAASTGTAISGLSGVAASNATLAWLGGGSLATGGWGVAGGSAVLGGLIAGPVIGVMGLTAAAKLNKEATRVAEQEAEVRLAVEQLKNAIVVLAGIDRRCAEIEQAITALAQRFDPLVTKLEQMVGQKTSRLAELQTELDRRLAEFARLNWLTRLWRRLSGKKPSVSLEDPLDFDSFNALEQQMYMTASQFAYALHALLKVRLLDEEGALTGEADQVIAQSREVINAEAQ